MGIMCQRDGAVDLTVTVAHAAYLDQDHRLRGVANQGEKEENLDLNLTFQFLRLCQI